MTTQAPINSPFNAHSTVDDVLKGLHLGGKTVVVTGGYAGIGREAVRALTVAGAKVIVPARNQEKALRNLKELPEVILGEMDLTDPASIDAFAKWFLAGNDKLDILINCAGVMANPLARDGRGYESQFSTNVLGHYQLTSRLWPALVAGKHARVVMLSSANHRANLADMLADPNFQTTEYEPWKAYAQSKAGNILLTVALDPIGSKSGIRFFAVHPGGILETDLARHMDLSIAKAHGLIDENDNVVIDPEKGWKTVPQGASTMVWAATSPLLEGAGGVYLANNEVSIQDADDADGSALTQTVAPSFTNPANAERFLRLCEELSGVRVG